MLTKRQITSHIVGGEPTRLIISFDKVLELVNNQYPNARREGSAGSWSWNENGIVVAASNMAERYDRHWLAIRKNTETNSPKNVSEHMYASSLRDIPAGPHWAIIETRSITIPGDERSRTNPGHGYPESTETYIIYRSFTNEQEFLNELQAMHVSTYGSREYRAIKVEPLKITTKVEIELQK